MQIFPCLSWLSLSRSAHRSGSRRPSKTPTRQVVFLIFASLCVGLALFACVSVTTEQWTEDAAVGGMLSTMQACNHVIMSSCHHVST